jgi:hypothetical protein
MFDSTSQPQSINHTSARSRQARQITRRFVRARQDGDQAQSQACLAALERLADRAVADIRAGQP